MHRLPPGITFCGTPWISARLLPQKQYSWYMPLCYTVVIFGGNQSILVPLLLHFTITKIFHICANRDMYILIESYYICSRLVWPVNERFPAAEFCGYILPVSRILQSLCSLCYTSLVCTLTLTFISPRRAQ